MPALLKLSRADSWGRRLATMNRRRFLAALGLAAISGRDAFAARFDTAFGPVDLPASPNRIVALDSAGAIALNYGVKPVGMTASDTSSLTPDGKSLAAEVPLVGQSTFDGQLRYERILMLRPDLIVGMIRGGTDYSALYGKLARIAPTVLLRAEGAGTLLDVTFRLAVVMGLEKPALAKKALFERRCRAIRERWHDTLATTTVAAISGTDRQIVVYAQNSWSGRVLRDLGVRFPDVSKDAEGNGVFLSYEETEALRDVGIILYPVVNGRPAPEVADLMQVAGFRDLPAVRNGNMVGIADLWPETHLEALSLLDELERFLTALSDRKP